MTRDEYQIEVAVERKTDRIDARYMRGDLTHDEYLAEMDALNKWADEQFASAFTMRTDWRA